MKLTPQKIEEIAKLARLDLTGSEKEMYAKQLSTVLDFIEQLNEVNTKKVTETHQVTGLKNVVRADEVVSIDENTRANLIAQFPEQKNNCLKVKAVFEEE